MDRVSLKQIESKVERALEARKETKADDFQLYLVMLEENGFPTDKSMMYFLTHKRNYPSYESIARARRKVQARRPELKGVSPAVTKLNESEYRAYALDKS